MCRNHRYFLEAIVAFAKIGVDTVLLNTDFAGRRTIEVAHNEKLRAIVADDEFIEALSGMSTPCQLIEAWPGRRLEEFIANGRGQRLSAPTRRAVHVILTSGTTGEAVALPRVALERQVGTVAAILERVPMHAGHPYYIAAPLFHAWGFGNLTLAWILGATVVVRSKFDPSEALSLIDEDRVRSVAIVPVMAQRLLDLPSEVRRAHDTSSVTNVQLSGSVMTAGLANRFQEEFGEILFNVYGSTEVGGIAYAVPADLYDEPATAGMPLRGTEVVVLDSTGRRLAAGATGNVFVRRRWRIYGRTRNGGITSTGDVGYLDSHGRLFITGRSDEMIVSGGENVYPSEVEKLIARHPEVIEAAVSGVSDPEFGQRLNAWVVRREDSSLTAAEVQMYVRANLARYKVPRDIAFVNSLPRNSAGKVVKRLLPTPEYALDPPP